MKSYKKPLPTLPPMPIEGDPVTLSSMGTLAKHISRSLRMVDRSLGRMTMNQMFAFHKGLLLLLQTLDDVDGELSKPKKPKSRDYEPKDPPLVKKWTPEMIFRKMLDEYLDEDYEGETYDDLKDTTLKELGLTSENISDIIVDSVSGTKIKYPTFNRDETATVKELFETLKAAKVFRGRKGPIRDVDNDDNDD